MSPASASDPATSAPAVPAAAARPAVAVAPKHIFRAALWMSGAIAGFSAMAVAGRELAGRLDTFEMMIWRSAIGLAVVAGVALFRGRLAEAARPRALPLHLLRNVVHFAGQNLWLLALGLIPLAQVFAVEFSYPILVALVAPALLGEPLRRVKILAALCGFAGILIVARPFGPGGIGLGLGAAFAAALAFAGSAITTKWLTRQVATGTILFWLCAMQLALALAAALADGRIARPAAADWPWLVVLGLAGLAAHWCLTAALALAPASVVTPIDFLRLPLIAVVGMLFYDEPLDLWVFVGGGVILVANWINLAAETAPLQPARPQP